MFGRLAECEALDGLLERARAGEAGVLVLEGEAGVGKTSLCEYAAAQAEDMGVLRVVGMEWESEFPLAALSELLRPLRHRLAELEEAPRLAASALVSGSGEPGRDQFALASATLALLAAEATVRPVLVVIDDVQEVDEASAAVMAFAFRRLQADAVAVVLAHRVGERQPLPGPWVLLRVSGLDAADSAQLLAARASGPIAPDVRDTIVVQTRGNPLALIELAAGLTAEQLAGREPLPDPLPLSDRGTASFGRRLRRLPQRTRDALIVVAAAGPASASAITAALEVRGLDLADLAEAEANGVVRFEEGRPVFTHPLVRAAAFSAANPPARRAAHAALASVSLDDAERRGWHLAAASISPSEEVAAALEAAANAAERRGGRPAASVALLKAVELSPPGPARLTRELRAANACFLAGHRERSVVLVEDVLRAEVPPPLRTHALLLQSMQAVWSPRPVDAVPVLWAAFDELAANGDPAAPAVGLHLCVPLVVSGAFGEAINVCRRVQALAVANDTERLAARFLGASIELRQGDADAFFGMAGHDFATLEDRLVASEATAWGTAVAFGWNWGERYDAAQHICEAQLAEAHRYSAATLMAYPLSVLGEVCLRRGEPAKARALLEQALAVGYQVGAIGLMAFTHAIRARLAAMEGDSDAVQVHDAAVRDVVEQTGHIGGHIYANHAAGLLELSLGQPAAAVAQLERNLAEQAALGVVLPTLVPWEGDFIDALIAAGELERAQQATARLDDESNRTRSRWGRAITCRSRAQLQPEHADDLCAEALGLLDDAPFDQARTHLVYGQHLRRRSRIADARTHLAAAAEGFERCGAPPWARRADSELRATGIRRATKAGGGEPLTEQELQVAVAIAGGATNRQAAAALFLSTKTVEYHLAKIFRKLAITNRTQLANQVAAGSIATI